MSRWDKSRRYRCRADTPTPGLCTLGELRKLLPQLQAAQQDLLPTPSNLTFALLFLYYRQDLLL